jgi:hypothetical protein
MPFVLDVTALTVVTITNHQALNYAFLNLHAISSVLRPRIAPPHPLFHMTCQTVTSTCAKVKFA